MALSESGSGVQVAPITYGGSAKKSKPKRATKKVTVRGGRKQSFFARPRGGRR